MNNDFFTVRNLEESENSLKALELPGLQKNTTSSLITGF